MIFKLRALMQEVNEVLGNDRSSKHAFSMELAKHPWWAWGCLRQAEDFTGTRGKAGTAEFRRAHCAFQALNNLVADAMPPTPSLNQEQVKTARVNLGLSGCSVLEFLGGILRS